MHRKWLVSLCAGGVALLAAALWQISSSDADPVRVEPLARQDDKGGADGPLPIRQVVLFNTGVGYFQREGQIDGTSRVELTFPSTDMNDLLKSLVLQDGGGGKISAVNYDSYDPIEKTLRSFAIDLSTNPTFGQILNQARGEKIEVAHVEKIEKKDVAKKPPEKKGAPAKGAPAAQPATVVRVIGTIVGMEVQPRAGDAREVEILNVTTADGLQAIPLNQVVSVRFLNAVLEKEFQRALQVLARAHDTQKKTISLGFQGDGKRTVRVGYVVERPIWKTSYRLRIEDNGKLFLQAWALVENTSDDDWHDVHMVLVSGRPISYKMNLYEPLYIPRPEVEPEMFASLRPPVYSGTLNDPKQDQKLPLQIALPSVPSPVPQNQNRQLNTNQVPGQGNNAIPGFMFANPTFSGGKGQGGAIDLGQIQGNFAQNGVGLNNPNPYQNSLQAGQPFNAKLTYEELQQRRKLQKDAKNEARRVVAGLNFKEGVASVASAEAVGDYYQYVLDQKINLSRQKSAMLPIMNRAIEGTKVSIFNSSVHPKFPLLGLRLKNTSGQPLTQGPITVYEGQTYAGDTRVLDLQPGEERLLSYALDQGTEVLAAGSEAPGPELFFKVGQDNLATNYKVRHTRTYTIKNRSPHERKMVVEHPITTGWRLLEPEKASTKTRDVYPFDVAVGAHKTITFKVTEEENRDENIKLAVNAFTRTADARQDVHVKLVSKKFEPKIIGMRFVKGALLLKQQVRESTAYFVQNLSIQERQSNIDYVIRPDWKLLLDDDQAKAGPAVQRVKLKLPPEKTVAKEFVEERTTIENTSPLALVTDERIKEWLGNAAASPEVKSALTKIMDTQRKLRETKARQTELEQQLKALTEDQARMRQNLMIIPQSSEPYKKFLEKFVAQETEVESLQKQVRQVQTSVQQVQREYDAYIANLTAE